MLFCIVISKMWVAFGQLSVFCPYSLNDNALGLGEKIIHRPPAFGPLLSQQQTRLAWRCPKSPENAHAHDIFR
jgi:hypothetical protein